MFDRISIPWQPVMAASTLILLIALGATAQVAVYPNEFERVDVIAIERDGLDSIRFQFGQRRSFDDSFGVGRRGAFRGEPRTNRIGFDRSARALGVAPGVSWREIRYHLREKQGHAPKIGLVADRLALVVTRHRALAFVSRGAWVEENLTPSESVEALRVGATVGVVATNHRALGVDVGRERFASIDLQVKEELESAQARDTLVHGANESTHSRLLEPEWKLVESEAQDQLTLSRSLRCTFRLDVLSTIARRRALRIRVLE